MNDIALKATNVRVAYGDLVAVWDVSLDLRPGSICALVGRNGAGKTTLLAGLAGLVPVRSGQVELLGQDITGMKPWARANRGMSLVMEGKRVFRGITIDENITLGVRAAGLNRTEARAWQDELYGRFPLLSGRRSNLAGSLSGGQQQLLAIATAFAAKPKVLLVDEPSSGLAPVVVDEILDVLVGLRDEGLAILLVEQLVEEVLDGIAETVVVMDSGRVVAAGPAETFDADALAASLYVVAPDSSSSRG